MTESRHRTNCDGPLSCGGEGQAAPDAILFNPERKQARSNPEPLGGKAPRKIKQRPGRLVSRRWQWRGSLLPSRRGKLRHLFREPRNHARRCRSDMFHAAPASLPRRVAGPRGVHAYSVPPVFFQVINPAHRFRLQNLSSRKTEICMETFAGWQKGFAGS